jgi:hypothetical protein
MRKGVIVKEPDGWNRADFERSWAEPITEFEFEQRVSRSTVQWIEQSDGPGPRSNVIPIEEWPKGVIPDGRMYQLECTRSMMLDPAKEAAFFRGEIDMDDALVPTSNSNGNFEKEKPPITYPRGGYKYLSDIARKLNAMQTQDGTPLTWLYFPMPLEEAGEGLAAA